MYEQSKMVFDFVDSGTELSSEEAIEIDKWLSMMKANKIPDENVQCIVYYINFRFLHDTVTTSAQDQLQAL